MSEKTDFEPCSRCSGTGWQGHPDDPAGRCDKCGGCGGVPKANDRLIAVPDALGAIGLGLAADVLEDAADQMKAHPLYGESLQMVADWLRQTATKYQEVAQ